MSVRGLPGFRSLSGPCGLGLAIARELAQRMSGRIAISSSKRFTAFTLDLPPAREPVDAAAPASAASEAGA